MNNRGKLDLVFTIGHSELAIGSFLRLLKNNEIDLVLDVRSSPYSRRVPQYNRAALAQALESGGLGYAFAGRSLGGRPTDPEVYIAGRVSYPRVARSHQFRLSLRRIIDLLPQYRIALVCAEREPLECHRFLLIGRALSLNGVSVEHILSDGNLESQSQGELRLLRVTGVNVPSTNPSPEAIARAYAAQESRVAFAEPKRAVDSDRQLSF